MVLYFRCAQYNFQTSLRRVDKKLPLINNVCLSQFLKQVINVVSVAKRSIYCECCGQVQVSLSVMTCWLLLHFSEASRFLLILDASSSDFSLQRGKSLIRSFKRF